MIQVRLSIRAAKDFGRLDPQFQRKITEKFQELREHPEPTALIRQLTGFAALYRLRIGNWRAVGPFDGEVFLVRWIGKRDDIYKQLRR